MSKRHKQQNSYTAGERLRSLIERVENLDEERKEICEQIKDVKNEAKSAGFDIKAFNQMLRERRMRADERSEFEALCDLYRGTLGMLAGTPLGDATRRRMMGMRGEDEAASAQPPSAAPSPPKSPSGEPWPEDDPANPPTPKGDAEAAREAAPEPLPPEPVVTVEQARKHGEMAAKTGGHILENPWAPMDPRRAAWDEGFCFAMGGDGMDIPAIWRRTPKKKAEPDEGTDEPKGGEP